MYQILSQDRSNAIVFHPIIGIVFLCWFYFRLLSITEYRFTLPILNFSALIIKANIEKQEVNIMSIKNKTIKHQYQQKI